MNTKQDVLMVDKELYDTMVAAYNRVKDERAKNKQLADKIMREMEVLQHEIDSLSAKISDQSTGLADLMEAIHGISEENLELRIKLAEKVEALTFGLEELKDNVHKLGNAVKYIQLNLKPLQERYKT